MLSLPIAAVGMEAFFPLPAAPGATRRGVSRERVAAFVAASPRGSVSGGGITEEEDGRAAEEAPAAGAGEVSEGVGAAATGDVWVLLAAERRVDREEGTDLDTARFGTAVVLLTGGGAS